MGSLKQGQVEPKKGFFTRWFESIAEARMRQVEREMKLHQAQHPWLQDAEEENKREETRH